MVCAPVRSIIPSLKLGDYLSVQAHNPCSISHLSETIKEFATNIDNVLIPLNASGRCILRNGATSKVYPVGT